MTYPFVNKMSKRYCLVLEVARDPRSSDLEERCDDSRDKTYRECDHYLNAIVGGMIPQGRELPDGRPRPAGDKRGLKGICHAGCGTFFNTLSGETTVQQFDPGIDAAGKDKRRG